MLEKWKEIYTFGKNGWFDFEDIYDMVVDKFNNTTFIEIGCWQGMSLSYLQLKIKEKNKHISCYGIDTFKGDPDNPMEQYIINNENLDLKNKLQDNFKQLSIIPSLIILDSVESADIFRNKELSFCFIDGGHSYSQICKDIDAWLPKIENGGIIAGHDYPSPGIKRAVEERFTNYNISNNSWWAQI